MRDAVEWILAEVRALRATVEEGRSELGAVTYKRAAEMLGVHVSELKLMVRRMVILSVTYAPGKRPKIPLSEIRRLTTPKPRLVEKPRGKPSRKRGSPGVMTPEELDEAAKNL